MTKPRKQLIDTSITPYYHIVSRCVRRSFLCGIDSQGKNFEHRRQWIEDKILLLPTIFPIQVCAYAVMSNHYHLVLHIDKAGADSWTAEEVIERCHRLFKGNSFSQQFSKGEPLTVEEHKISNTCVALWRSRLADTSWFMRQINENPLHARPTMKTGAQAVFGRVVLNHRHCWTKNPSRPAWSM